MAHNLLFQTTGGVQSYTATDQIAVDSNFPEVHLDVARPMPPPIVSHVEAGFHRIIIPKKREISGMS